MRIPTVDKFLCCLRLETGGTVMGWFGGFGAVFGFVIFGLSFGMAIADYEGFLKAIGSGDQDKPINNPSQFRKFNQKEASEHFI